MTKLFTREQARSFLRENNLKDAQSIQSALVDGFKELLQEALEAELEQELGYSKHDWKNKKTDNARNGHSKKTVQSDVAGEFEIAVPRDRMGEFEPVIVKKNDKKVSNSIDDMIISMYAKNMSTRDIHAHMERIYGINISPEMVSKITDKVLPLAKEWQNRGLEEVYPIIQLDGIVVNVNQDGQITKKTAYIAFGINLYGYKDILGVWIGESESAKFWMKALVDLKNRGVKDILIACIDGLSGFEQAISAVFPKTEIQGCIVHQIRNCTKFVSYKDRKEFCADMKPIYHAPNEEAAKRALAEFEEKWGKKYPYAVKSWYNNWDKLSTFFKYPEEIRRIIYTTNPIESFNRQVRKITKTKNSFPTDDALLKVLYLIIQEVTDKWTMPVHNWNEIINKLAIYFADRLEQYL